MSRPDLPSVDLRCPAQDLAHDLPTAETLGKASLIAVVASVRYGHHLKEADALLALYRTLQPLPPLAVASVNLTARKPGKDTAQGNAYLRKWIVRQQLTPAFSAAFAGRLDYPRYGWLDRQMIRLIMKMTGGPTDPTTTIEYTDWAAVDRFATALARPGRGSRLTRGPALMKAAVSGKPRRRRSPTGHIWIFTGERARNRSKCFLETLTNRLMRPVVRLPSGGASKIMPIR